MLSYFIRVWLFATLWTTDPQAPLSMGFPRQEYWSGLPFPSPGGLSDPGMEPGSPALQVDSLPSEPPGKPIFYHKHSLIRDTSLQYCYKGPEFSRYHKKSRKVVCKIRGRQPLQNVHLKERGLRSCFQILALLFAGPMNSRGLISTCVTRRVSISELLRGWYERVYIKSLTHTWHSTT